MLITQAVFSALEVPDLSAGLSLSSLAEYLAGRRMLARRTLTPTLTWEEPDPWGVIFPTCRPR